MKENISRIFNKQKGGLYKTKEVAIRSYAWKKLALQFWKVLLETSVLDPFSVTMQTQDVRVAVV